MAETGRLTDRNLNSSTSSSLSWLFSASFSEKTAKQARKPDGSKLLPDGMGRYIGGQQGGQL